MNRPVWEMLEGNRGRLSFHMPGHKGRGPFGPVDAYALDTTELPGTDDLYCPENGLRAAVRRCFCITVPPRGYRPCSCCMPIPGIRCSCPETRTFPR